MHTTTRHPRYRPVRSRTGARPTRRPVTARLRPPPPAADRAAGRAHLRGALAAASRGIARRAGRGACLPPRPRGHHRDHELLVWFPPLRRPVQVSRATAAFFAVPCGAERRLRDHAARRAQDRRQCADEGVIPARLVLNQRRDRRKTRKGESKVDGDEDHHGEDRRGGDRRELERRDLERRIRAARIADSGETPGV